MATIPSKLSSAVLAKYSVDRANLSFSATPKDNPKDRIQVELGDSKDASTFQPQLKVMRWDNEVNFSVRLKDDQVATEAVTTSQEKIIWSKGNIEANFYDLTEGEGGYEFEIILKEKPLTNKIEFTLNTKGLDFFYQPPLTEEIKVGDEDGRIVSVTETDAFDKDGNFVFHRPENVVGSYVFYHQTKGGINNIYGKDYKTGQGGHIYRPKITDSVGTEVWGDLHIENGILSVIIPQDFLDNAVYPVRHAAGLTIGYTTIGASTDNFNQGNMRGPCTGATGAGGGTASEIKMCIWLASGTGHQKMAIFNNTGPTPPSSTSYPDTLITNSYGGEITVVRTTKPTQDSEWTSGGAITGVLSGSTYYWLMTECDNNSIQWSYNTGSAYIQRSGTLTYANFPPADTGDLSSSGTKNYSIYATYTAGGGTNVTVNPSVQTATSSIPAPTITAIRNITVSPSVQSITSSLPTPTITAVQNVTISSSVQSITSSQPTPTVSAIQNVTITPTIFSDNFNRADSTTIGNYWVEESGDWTIASNKLSSPGSADTIIYNTTDPVSADYSLTSTVNAGSGGVGDVNAGILLRRTASNTYYIAQLNMQTDKVYVSKVISGSSTELANGDVTLNISTDYVFKFEVHGNQLRAFVDGNLIASASDSAITGVGNFGFRQGSNSITITFDNVVLESFAMIQTVTASQPAPTVITGGDVIVSPSVQTLISSLPSPTVTTIRNVTVSATVQSLTSSQPSLSVSGSANISSAVQTVTFSQQTITVTGSALISAGVQTVTFSQPSPTVTAIKNVSISASVQSPTFSQPAPTVTTIKNVTVSASVQSLSSSLPQPTVTTIGANTHSLDLEASSSQYAYITDANQTGLDITGDLTIEGWVKFETTPTVGALMTFVSRYNGDVASSAYQFYLYNDAGNLELLYLVCNGSNIDVYEVAWTPSTGTWYHIAVTWNASAATAKFYVNGLQQGSNQVKTQTSINNSALNFEVGRQANAGSYFDGVMDDLRVWNDIRTPTEISDNMEIQLNGNEANLQGYWKFNNDYLDATANNNDLTASGSPVFTSDIPFIGDPNISIYAGVQFLTFSQPIPTVTGMYGSLFLASALRLDFSQPSPRVYTPTVYNPMYASQGTTYTNKYTTQGTTYKDKY